MSKVDITLAIIIMVGAYNGFKDGFLMEVFAFLALLLGVLLGFKLMAWAMLNMEQQFNIDSFTLPYIGFGAVFFTVTFLVNLLLKYIDKKVNHSFLGIVDHTAGGLLGIFRTAFMASILLWLFHSLKFQFPDPWTEDSWFLPFIAELAPTITHGLAEIIPVFKGVF